MTPTEYDEFLRKAFDAFLAARASRDCLANYHYLPYDAVDLSGLRWPGMGDVLIRDELRELTNNLNAWLTSLRHWHAWLAVARNYSEDDRWELEHEFIATLATFCLFQPSAVRDAFTFVVTNGMHQVRRAINPAYKDHLPLDKAPWEKRGYPARGRVEQQLKTVVCQWPSGAVLLENLKQLDDEVVRRTTSDFRNRASHSIAPRFSIGLTRAVTRAVVQATRMEQQNDGFFHVVPIPGQTVISYGFGGTEALRFEEMLDLNLKQFRIAITCFDCYVSMLNAAVGNSDMGVK